MSLGITDLRSQERKAITPGATEFVEIVAVFAASEQVTPVDYVSLQDYEDAINLLLRFLQTDGAIEFMCSLDVAVKDGDLGSVGKAWRERSANHLSSKVDRYFRDRPVLTNEQAALSYITTMAEHLTEAGQALEHAAQRLLKKHGDGYGANQVHQASVKALAAAQELVGGKD